MPGWTVVRKVMSEAGTAKAALSVATGKVRSHGPGEARPTLTGEPGRQGWIGHNEAVPRARVQAGPDLREKRQNADTGEVAVSVPCKV